MTSDQFNIVAPTDQDSKRIFRHKKSRTTVALDKNAEEIAEAFYSCELELAKACYAAINRAFPINKRKTNEKMAERAMAAQQEVKQFLNRYKNIVRNEILPMALLKRHHELYDAKEDKPTSDLRILILGQFQVYKKKLVDFSGLFVPLDETRDLISVLDNVFPDEYERLRQFLSYYECDPRFLSPDEFLNR